MNKVELTPHHVGISVAKLDESIKWYEEMLGFTLSDRLYVEHLRCEIAIIKNGNFEIELFRHDDTLPQPEGRLHPDTDMITQGTKHICFSVKDVDGLVDSMRQRGVKVLVGPGVFGSNRFYYICDNTGVLIELNQPL